MADDRSIAEAIRRGLELFDFPERFDGHAAENNGARIVHARIGDTHFLYALASAAIQDLSDNENFFTTVAANLIAELQPYELVLNDPSRLVRNSNYEGTIASSLEGNVDTLVYSDGTEDLTQGIGVLTRIKWLFASSARHDDVKKKIEGRVQQARAGRWPTTRYALPAGYWLGKYRSIHLDHDMVEPLRELLAMLATPGLEWRDITDAMDRLGIPTLRLHEHYGPRASWRDIRKPWQQVKIRLYQHADMYEHGRYKFLLNNPLPAIREYVGVKVQRPDMLELADTWLNQRKRREDLWGRFGVIEVDVPLPQPPGGWAPPHLFRAIREIHGPRGNEAPRGKVALASLPHWEADGKRYRLVSDHLYYRLVMVDLDVPAPTARELPPWWNGEFDTRVPGVVTVAVADRFELERSVGVTLARSVGRARVVRTVRNRPVSPRQWEHLPQPALTPNDLREQAEELRRQAKQARDNSNMVRDPELQAEYRADSERLAAEARDLDAKAAAAAEPLALPLPDQFEAEVGLLKAGLTALLSSGEQVAKVPVAALHQVLTGFRVWPDGLNVAWETKVVLATNDGWVELGPFGGVVRERGIKSSLPPAERNRLLAERVLLEVDPADAPRVTAASHTWPLILDGLRQLGVEPADRAAVIARVPLLVRQSIATTLLGSEAPTGASAEFAQWVSHVYLDGPVRFRPPWWGNDCRGVRLVIDILVQAGGSMSLHALKQAFRDRGIDPGKIVGITRSKDRRGGGVWPEPIAKEGPWINGRSPRAWASLRSCPHPGCEGLLTVAVRVPEVTDGLLCPECRRMPSDASVVFPDLYFGLPAWPELLPIKRADAGAGDQ